MKGGCEKGEGVVEICDTMLSQVRIFNIILNISITIYFVSFCHTK